MLPYLCRVPQCRVGNYLVLFVRPRAGLNLAKDSRLLRGRRTYDRIGLAQALASIPAGRSSLEARLKHINVTTTTPASQYLYCLLIIIINNISGVRQATNLAQIKTQLILRS